jgi:hypothetical protein
LEESTGLARAILKAMAPGVNQECCPKAGQIEDYRLAADSCRLQRAEARDSFAGKTLQRSRTIDDRPNG